MSTVQASPDRFSVKLKFAERDCTVGGLHTKWQKQGYWYKAFSQGYADVAEWLTSQLLMCSNLESSEYVRYELGDIYIPSMGREYKGVRSLSFLKKGEEFVSFTDLLQDGPIPSYRLGFPENWQTEWAEFLAYVQKVTGLDVEMYVSKCATLDMLILNDDRNADNLGVIRRVDGSYRLAPLFDHHRAFLSSVSEWPYGASLEACRADISPAVLAGSYADHTALLPAPGLRFDVRQVSALLSRYEAFLGRAGDVLRMQMQEYPEYFI